MTQESLSRSLKEQTNLGPETVAAALSKAATTPAATKGQVEGSTALVADTRQTKLNVSGWELEGISISGQETSIIVPRAKVTFDIGRCPQRACFQQTVLLSHTHLDHVGGLPFHVCTRNMLQLPPSKVVVPQGFSAGVRKLMDAVLELQFSPAIGYEVLELEAGQNFELPSGFLCRTFPTTHAIPSQGYVIYSQRKKLKTELQGKSQAEIKELRLSGVDVTETHQVPEIAFTGDTTSAFLDAETNPTLEDALKAKVLCIEMTFLGDDVTVEEARGKGHMHVSDFVAHAHRFQNDSIVLIHFSPRYKRSEILHQLDIMLPPVLRAKCVPLLNGIE
ncbi:hypothetical protein HYH02_006029 [Chlamydomonas schloesseri]|uniref:Metallo-beta-lactamase domain-containing protein n=1 Tax=Chlamydomonas schloesseri TaxID=2026947 RepID=A0A836B625_9CHLO|nr:hypothetical protein HYH02_006029 [Chlamydomonas schloesseri]|eukprot:KAG2448672.1 hypothetical protein HYH02_006029 [Chlamydomonas schloesseri]